MTGNRKTLQVAALCLFAAAMIAEARGNPLTPLQRQGAMLAQRLCAGCHATGKRGPSPHRGAPPFRDLASDVDLDGFAARLRNGLTVGHPDMPMFRFSRDDARALTAYLRAVQTR